MSVSNLRQTVVVLLFVWATSPAPACTQERDPVDGAIVKAVLDSDLGGENLLDADSWRPWQAGFEWQDNTFVCDNGGDPNVQRGLSQTVVLNQQHPEPIVAVAWSRAEGVTGTPDSNYALYLDLVYEDGTSLWGQVAPFATGTHTWQRRQVAIFPDRPVRSLSFHMLLRNHGGKAWFRDPELRAVHTPRGACLYDGVPVKLVGQPKDSRFATWQPVPGSPASIAGPWGWSSNGNRQNRTIAFLSRHS